MMEFFVVLIIIIAYLSGYHAGRYTTDGWISCKDRQPLANGLYMVTVVDDNYAHIFYWDVFEGWHGDIDSKVVAWRPRIKGWR